MTEADFQQLVIEFKADDALIRRNSATLAAAKRRARHGHQDWVFWNDAGGEAHAARQSVAAVEAAIEAVGPGGKFFLDSRSMANRMASVYN